jgi:hypothetical protein
MTTGNALAYLRAFVFGISGGHDFTQKSQLEGEPGVRGFPGCELVEPVG